jgi:hypothetical protein
MTALREHQRPRDVVQWANPNQQAMPQEVVNNDWEEKNHLNKCKDLHQRSSGER